MRIQSNDIPIERLEELAQALGEELGLLDNQRNTRAATPDEVRAWIFAPAKALHLKFVTKRAIAANPPNVEQLDA